MESTLKPTLNQTPSRKYLEIVLETLMIVGITVGILSHFPNSSLAGLGFGVAFINLLRLWFSKPLNQAFYFLYKWRWIIAFIVFVLGVLFQLHFSNVASYMARFTAPSSVADSILFGVPRTFRADEYNVQLPYYFSQYYNNYQQISHQMSISGQDMIVGYNSPVWSLTLIGKPFVWGYLLFGNAYGLSWYFLSKTILMFMVSLELFYILTKSRHMAIFGAFLFTFAPANVWWFSPHFYDAIFWACALFVVGYFFFKEQGWKKWGFTLLAISALTGYTLALFPSLQVPLGVLMLFLMLACLYRDRQELVWEKKNLWNVVCVLLGLLIVLGPALWSMKEALKLLLETEYPGSRVSLGGEDKTGVWKLFFNTTGIFQPFEDPVILNNSEISSYTHFGIAFMMFYPYLWWTLRQNKVPQRYVGDVLFLALCFQLVFFFFEFPEWLAKITLLSMCNRIHTVFGVTATFFTIWSFQMVSTQSIAKKAWAGAIVCVAYCALSLDITKHFLFPGFVEMVRDMLPSSLEFLVVPIFYFIPILVAFGLWLTFTKWRELFYCGLACWTGIAGLLVNPLMQGTAAITDYPLARVVQEQVNENPEAWWLTLRDDLIQGLLLANGAKVLNGVNFYPDLEKWELLGLNDEDSLKAVNRYSHILTNLVEKETYVTSPSGDVIDLRLNPKDFEKLDIQYVVGLKSDADLLTALGIPYKALFEDRDTQDMIFDVSVSIEEADNKAGLEVLAQNKP